jgi:hypothetical protein
VNTPVREEDLARDPLAMRLARIAEPPVPPELLRQVLARRRATRPARRRRARTIVAVAAVLAAATALTAMVTPMRSYVGDLAAQMGLGRTGHDLAVVSGGGQTIRVTSGVDDGWVVILNVRAEPGQRDRPGVWIIGKLTASDATGHQLESMGWQGNQADGGDEALAMFRRPPDGAPAGSAITFHDQPLISSPNRQDLNPAPGPGWTLRVRVPASPPPTREPLPAPGRVAGVDVTFVDVRASDRYVVVVIEGTGPGEQEIGNVTGPSALTDPHGGHVPNMAAIGFPAEATPGGDRERWEMYWPRQGTGTYHLVVGSGLGQELHRDLVIR